MPDPKKIEPEIMPPDTPREYSAIAARQATVRAFGELLVTVYAPQPALLTSRGREMSGTKPPEGVLPERDPGPMFKADNKERWGAGRRVIEEAPPLGLQSHGTVIANS